MKILQCSLWPKSSTDVWNIVRWVSNQYLEQKKVLSRVLLLENGLCHLLEVFFRVSLLSFCGDKMDTVLAELDHVSVWSQDHDIGLVTLAKKMVCQDSDYVICLSTSTLDFDAVPLANDGWDDVSICMLEHFSDIELVFWVVSSVTVHLVVWIDLASPEICTMAVFAQDDLWVVNKWSDLASDFWDDRLQARLKHPVELWVSCWIEVWTHLRLC